MPAIGIILGLVARFLPPSGEEPAEGNVIVDSDGDTLVDSDGNEMEYQD